MTNKGQTWLESQRFQEGTAFRQESGASADPFAASPVRELYTAESAKAMVAKVRAALARDSSPETLAALNSELARGIESFWGYWFQRIEFPAQHISSTSNHKLANLDEGGLNTLERRLTSDEASIMRPFPKWLYIEPVLPDLRGKSVLELGTLQWLLQLPLRGGWRRVGHGRGSRRAGIRQCRVGRRRARSQERRIPQH